MQYVEVASRLLLLTMFALALVSKISSRRAWAEFVESTRAMAVVGDAQVAAVAVATAAAEGAVIVLAAVPLRWAGSVAFVIAAGLLGSLTVAVALVVRRGKSVTCRCFGASQTPLGVSHVVRNALLVVIALLGLAGSLVTGPFDLFLTVIVGVFGAVLGLLVARWDDLVSLLVAP
ncbi:MauE/DoxX family redox-associated membrane protein [Nonomuraea guangzhouensis]|uniref:MauE/DoxX family redox-associated membrane protein n=1 Tax=Nonomuraea guangzhouensis TaxID=1291555 RepID=A0ABW4G724_9ACTN|nr:MauE/DoxX family redox-associated membrane protein [Nonomuraea guangzhouensis]